VRRNSGSPLTRAFIDAAATIGMTRKAIFLELRTYDEQVAVMSSAIEGRILTPDARRGGRSNHTLASFSSIGVVCAG
jgi:hypothetical protein